jgi:predicted PolB exonuclease-like 3'-5' exonuclease
MAAPEPSPRGTGDAVSRTAYLVMDTESVPDGKLLAQVKYPEQNLTPEEAVARAQAEARDRSATGSDFLPVSFQYPVAVCILRIGVDYGPQALTCLDAPLFRPRKIVEQFWAGLAAYNKPQQRDKVKLVTYNGRSFDLPLLELAAFRYGCCCGADYFQTSRNRYGGGHIDLMEWLNNYGAVRTAGGLNLVSKLLGKPGKMEIKGDQVYRFYQEGRAQEINDYCMFDTLDTYFVFLRSRILTGELTLEQEHVALMRAKTWLASRVSDLPALQKYLDNWGDWDPWP